MFIVIFTLAVLFATNSIGWTIVALIASCMLSYLASEIELISWRQVQYNREIQRLAKAIESLKPSK